MANAARARMRGMGQKCVSVGRLFHFLPASALLVRAKFVTLQVNYRIKGNKINNILL